MAKFKCIHNIIKEKIDALFEQAILAACCFYNGRFMFEGKKNDRAIDFILGLSEKGHRKRTMAAYETLDEISFKNNYLLLSSILEESYYLIKGFADQHSEYNLPEKYNHYTFTKGNIRTTLGSCRLRFDNIAYIVQLIANVIKHSGGIIKEEERSGKDLIKEFKFKN